MKKAEIIRDYKKIKTKEAFLDWLHYQFDGTKGNLQIPEILDNIIQAERNGCAKRVGIVMDKKSTTHVDCYIREPIMEAIRDKQ